MFPRAKLGLAAIGISAYALASELSQLVSVDIPQCTALRFSIGNCAAFRQGKSMGGNAVKVRAVANPVHSILQAFPIALYPSALLSDITYYNTAVIQWTNFSSWLIAGAAFFTGVVVAWALFSFFLRRDKNARGPGLLYLGVVTAMFVLGVWNALHHARDGWHSVGEFGIMLSVLCTLLAFLAAFLIYGPTVRTEKRA